VRKRFLRPHPRPFRAPHFCMKEEPADPNGLDGSLVHLHYTTKALIGFGGLRTCVAMKLGQNRTRRINSVIIPNFLSKRQDAILERRAVCREALSTG
jgi:hypothetical protein